MLNHATENAYAKSELSRGDDPAIQSRVGRKMRYPEKREAAFEAGTLARIQSTLAPDETQVSFIRIAVERELNRRSRTP